MFDDLLGDVDALRVPGAQQSVDTGVCRVELDGDDPVAFPLCNDVPLEGGLDFVEL